MSVGKKTVDVASSFRASNAASVCASNVASWNSGGTLDELPAERLLASFDVETLTNFMDGGVAQTVRRRWITGSTEHLKDHGGKSSRFDLERSGNKGAIAANFVHFMKVHKKHLDRFYMLKGNEMLYMLMGQTMGGYPGFGLFLLTLQGQASMDQLADILPRAYTMGITGSYAQTELGHGSNVRGLRTTATYDAHTQEFVLDTPTLSAMKWWPSNMATSTHTLLYAQLIIHGKEQGVHVFFVQLRDEHLAPLPGVEVGDLGTKVGENEVDIGYLRLKGVRIPRRHMMEKRQHVEPDGTYVRHSMGEAQNDKAAYLTMMGARVHLVAASSVFLGKGATIATRYNAVRRQGFADTSAHVSFQSPERKIIDYKMNQYVLLSNMSLAYCIRATASWLTAFKDQVTLDPDAVTMETMAELHASSAGLKGYCCNAVALGLEELRKSTGGAGYLMASGVAGLAADFKWRATAEGDTVPMLLQTARYLMKAAANAKAGHPLGVLTACLGVFRDPAFSIVGARPKLANTVEAYMDVQYLLQWLRYRTVAQVAITKQLLDAKLAAGVSYDAAWAGLTLRAARTGQSHVLYFMTTKFADTISTCSDPACRLALERMCVLFALSDMMDGHQWTGLVDITQTTLIEQACSRVCSLLRPDAVALADAWDFTDRALGSTIGNKAGDVYEQQYLAAARSATNAKVVPEFFDAIRPFLDLEFLSLRNGPMENTPADDTDSYPPPLRAKL